MNNKYKIIIITILFSANCFAQFKYKAEIPVVDKSEYYHILLTPEITAHSASDFSDIRIKNENGNEIAYLLREEKPKEDNISFEDFEIIQNDFIQPDSITSIIVFNKNKEALNQFCISTYNAEVQKYVSIRGSNDKKNWYIVKQKTPASSFLTDKFNEMLIIDFPSGDYLYYNILIDNDQKEPILVLNAGKYKYSEILGKYTEITIKDFSQTDSTDKSSYISFPKLESKYLIDKITFEINSQQYYLRKGIIEKINPENNIYTVQAFILSSKSPNTIATRGLTIDKQTLIKIDNNDNAPLDISEIRFYQLNRYITIFLEADKKYTLFYSDNKLKHPEYDIIHFENEIPGNLSLIKPFRPEQLNNLPKEIKKGNFFESPAFMWIIIIIAGGLLTFMCFHIIKKSKT